MKNYKHTDAWERCVKHVKKQEGYNPFAVCTKSLGKKKSFEKIY